MQSLLLSPQKEVTFMVGIRAHWFLHFLPIILFHYKILVYNKEIRTPARMGD
jgi:hypothetical protein